MNPVWKSVVITSALWAVLLVIVTGVTFSLSRDEGGDGRYGMSAGAQRHPGSGMMGGGYGGGGMMGGGFGNGGGMMGGGYGGGMMGGAMIAQSEYEYLAMMVPHHEEAIAAAGELSRSDSPQMQQFGEDIIASQTEQVRLMKGWLDEWYPDQPADDAAYTPEMRDLSGLSGDDLDRAFLTDMMGHHMMAVMSSQHLLMRGDVEHDEVADLAVAIRDEQSKEIRWMQQQLSGDPNSGDASLCPGWAR